MLTMLFGILMIWIFGKMLVGAVKLTWGISKILLNLVLLPLVLIGMVFGGLIYIAFPILILVGIASMVRRI